MMNAASARRDERDVVCRSEGPPEAAASFAAGEVGPAVRRSRHKRVPMPLDPRADFVAHTRHAPLRRPLLHGWALCVLALLALLLLAGCGGEQSIAGDTPQETAEAFVEAMQAGEYERAATGYDYVTYARRENSDWDSFGEHQRNLIVESLQEDKVGEIQALAGMFATGEASVANVQEQNGSANVSISAGANTLILQMRQIEDQWLIADVVEQAG